MVRFNLLLSRSCCDSGRRAVCPTLIKSLFPDHGSDRDLVLAPDDGDLPVDSTTEKETFNDEIFRR